MTVHDVAVIGAGNVGAAVANSLILLGVGDRTVLYDRQLARAEGEAWDIADGTPMVRGIEIVGTDDWQDVRGARVVVVTVGTLMHPGGSRLDERNGDLLRDVIEQLDSVAPDAVVVVVTNPVDVMTRIAQEASARPWHRIIGTGTVLDTARLRHGLARRLGVDAQNAHVHVIGEHGDSSFPAWSSAAIGPVPLAAFPLPPGEDLEELQADCAGAGWTYSHARATPATGSPSRSAASSNRCCETRDGSTRSRLARSLSAPSATRSC